MNRRAFLAAALAVSSRPLTALAGTTLEVGQTHPLHAAWVAWKGAYLSGDGRVIDAFQEAASHSEGQGYGMTLATIFGDTAAFDLMFDWTERTLAVRADSLLAWRWRPVAGGGALDRNNASDGDVLYAWALMRAAASFQRPALVERARAIVDALLARCIVGYPDGSSRLLLLPAVEGFVTEGAVVVNPSYLIPLAMIDLADSLDRPVLAQCTEDGLAMLGALAADGLAPDWVKVTAAGYGPADRLSPNNGYDAMRVGLYLAWSGLAEHPAAVHQAEAYRRTAAEDRWTPTVMEPRSMRALERSPHAGYAALRGLLVCLDDEAIGSTIPPFTTEQPYYPATLHLLALVAQAERYPRCLPI